MSQKTTVGDELCVVPKVGADRDIRPYKNAFLDSLSITSFSLQGWALDHPAQWHKCHLWMLK